MQTADNTCVQTWRKCCHGSQHEGVQELTSHPVRAVLGACVRGLVTGTPLKAHVSACQPNPTPQTL